MALPGTDNRGVNMFDEIKPFDINEPEIINKPHVPSIIGKAVPFDNCRMFEHFSTIEKIMKDWVKVRIGDWENRRLIRLPIFRRFNHVYQHTYNVFISSFFESFSNI